MVFCCFFFLIDLILNSFWQFRFYNNRIVHRFTVRYSIWCRFSCCLDRSMNFFRSNIADNRYQRLRPTRHESISSFQVVADDSDPNHRVTDNITLTNVLYENLIFTQTIKFLVRVHFSGSTMWNIRFTSAFPTQ